jgi:hypothetical protein
MSCGLVANGRCAVAVLGISCVSNVRAGLLLRALDRYTPEGTTTASGQWLAEERFRSGKDSRRPYGRVSAMAVSKADSRRLQCKGELSPKWGEGIKYDLLYATYESGTMGIESVPFDGSRALCLPREPAGICRRQCGRESSAVHLVWRMVPGHLSYHAHEQPVVRDAARTRRTQLFTN